MQPIPRAPRPDTPPSSGRAQRVPAVLGLRAKGWSLLAARRQGRAWFDAAAGRDPGA